MLEPENVTTEQLDRLVEADVYDAVNMTMAGSIAIYESRRPGFDPMAGTLAGVTRALAFAVWQTRKDRAATPEEAAKMVGDLLLGWFKLFREEDVDAKRRSN